MSDTMVATVSPRERQLRGRGTRRYQLPMHEQRIPPNPSGLCMCGCGAETARATQNDLPNDILRGEHRRFLKSHHLCGVPRSDETRARIRSANVGRAGVENPRWQGGVQYRRGRKYLLVGEAHPMANGSGGYVAEYRLVMAEKIGRPLTSHEDVHHIDGDHQNNDPENLALVSRSQHRRIHLRINKGEDPREALRAVMGST